MLTRLGASQVPVTYLRRSSIAMWGAAPVVWNASGLLALAASRRASAVFVARNCASRNGREQARPATRELPLFNADVALDESRAFISMQQF